MDLQGEKIEHHTGPSGDRYRHAEKVRRDETLNSAARPGLEVRAGDVLG